MAGYWIVLGNSRNDEKAAAEYAEKWKPIAMKFNAKFRAGPAGHVVKEGVPAERAFIVEFLDFDTAVSCYESDEYQALIPVIERAYDRQLIILPAC